VAVRCSARLASSYDHPSELLAFALPGCLVLLASFSVLEFDLLPSPNFEDLERCAHDVLAQLEYPGLFLPGLVLISNREIVIALLRKQRPRTDEDTDRNPTASFLPVLERRDRRIWDAMDPLPPASKANSAARVIILNSRTTGADARAISGAIMLFPRRPSPRFD